MIAAPVVAGVVSVGAAAYARYRGRVPSDAADEGDEVLVVESNEEHDNPESNHENDKPDEKYTEMTWKESAGRVDGRDGYVFGDLTRGVCVKAAKAFGKADELDVEAQGDAQFSQVQRLVLEAVKVYRARGYTGTISMSQTVAYFNESVSVSVKPGEGDSLPWEVDNGHVRHPTDSSTDKIATEGRAGLVFATLLLRLERRARAWQAMTGLDGLEPNLTQSAQIGFAIPVVKIGWGVSVSLTVSASSLLRWADHVAALQVKDDTRAADVQK